jgi:hypothetical protein
MPVKAFTFSASNLADTLEATSMRKESLPKNKIIIVFEMI